MAPLSMFCRLCACLLRMLVGGNCYKVEDTTLVPLPDGRILQAPAEPLRRMLGHLEAFFVRKEPLLNRFDEDLLACAEAMGAGVRGGEKLRERCTELRRLGAEYALPPTLGLFHGSLRPYQQEGVAWLRAIMLPDVQGFWLMIWALVKPCKLLLTAVLLLKVG